MLLEILVQEPQEQHKVKLITIQPVKGRSRTVYPTHMLILLPHPLLLMMTSSFTCPLILIRGFLNSRGQPSRPSLPASAVYKPSRQQQPICQSATILGT